MVNKSHPDYELWRGIVRRACYPKKKDAKYYKNITIDSRWKLFKNFLQDMGPRKNKNLTIDRSDNSKGYYKENCRWATMAEQSRNKRKPTACRKGHLWTKESTLWTSNGVSKVRRCKICLLAYQNKLTEKGILG